MQSVESDDSSTTAEMAELAAFESSPAENADQPPGMRAESDDTIQSEETPDLTVTAPPTTESQQLQTQTSEADAAAAVADETAKSAESTVEADAAAEPDQPGGESS
jgi:hypothetical protein